MPLFKTIPVAGGLIGVWEMTESSEELLRFFSSEETNNLDFQKYTHEKRKVEWLASRLMLKQLIGSDFAVSYSETGKPILGNNCYKHISISHSRDFVVVFVHENLEVGIDIENLTRNYHSIEKRYLSDLEQKQASGNPKIQCIYWCAKEAIFKLVPDIGVEFREQINILPFNPETDSQFKVRYISGERQTEYHLRFLIFSDHCLAWVTS
jgi:4'-phosphopantetheinyl transferase